MIISLTDRVILLAFLTVGHYLANNYDIDRQLYGTA